MSWINQLSNQSPLDVKTGKRLNDRVAENRKVGFLKWHIFQSFFQQVAGFLHKWGMRSNRHFQRNNPFNPMFMQIFRSSFQACFGSTDNRLCVRVVIGCVYRSLFRTDFTCRFIPTTFLRGFQLRAFTDDADAVMYVSITDQRRPSSKSQAVRPQ